MIELAIMFGVFGNLAVNLVYYIRKWNVGNSK